MIGNMLANGSFPNVGSHDFPVPEPLGVEGVGDASLLFGNVSE
jgi:hypothetical protein